MKFTKMHGIGNDYIYINCFEEAVPNPAELSRRMSPRRFSVGADGIILILPSDIADFKMRIFNADGSEAEMCGNGIRCFGKYVYDTGMTSKDEVTVETLAGVKTLELTTAGGVVEKVKVNMGTPVLERKAIPMSGPNGRVIGEELASLDTVFKITAVSMGNPHCVIFVDDVDTFPVQKYGPDIENNPVFPNRVNVEFVEVAAPSEVKMRVWERGSGETFACGTGACATCVAGVLNKLTERNITVHLLGGNLDLQWNADGNIFMTGPAEKVYDGVYDERKR